MVISEDAIALMASAAYSVPSIIDMHTPPVIDRIHVIKMVNMFMDEAIKYVSSLGIKPLPIAYVREEVHILCDDLLSYVGEFEGGTIPQQIILKHTSSCSGRVAVLHSHPTPIPVPTIEDVISSLQIGYRVECVISKSSNRVATIVCVEPLRSWINVATALYNISESVLTSTRYIVVGDDMQIKFLPFPNTTEQNTIIQAFIKILSKHASILYARIDLAENLYDVEMFK